jgi:hypothetical protein
MPCEDPGAPRKYVRLRPLPRVKATFYAGVTLD